MRRVAFVAGLSLMVGVQSQARDDFCAGIALLSTPSFYDRFSFLVGLVDAGADKPGVHPVKSVLPGYGECEVEVYKWHDLPGKNGFPIGYRYACKREMPVRPIVAQNAVRRCLDATWKSRFPLGEDRVTFNQPPSFNFYNEPGCRGSEITVGGENGRELVFEEDQFWCLARVLRHKPKEDDQMTIWP
jgi:hypothetical protein